MVIDQYGRLKVSLSGSGSGWPFAKVFSVSTTDPNADFASVAAAAAAAASGDAFLFDAEVFTCDDVTFPANVALIGQGDNTIFRTTANAECLRLDEGGVLINLRCENTFNNAASTDTALRQNTSAADVILYNVSCYVNNAGAGGTGNGAVIFKGKLFDCRIDSTADSSGRALSASSDVKVFGGEYDGSHADLLCGTGATIRLYTPTLVNNTVSNASAATAFTGQYFDAAGDLITIDTTGISGGVWLHKANGLKIKQADLPTAITNSASGDRIVLDNVQYTATATITVNKSITIDGLDPKTSSVTRSTNTSTIFDITTTGVTIKNLSISHTGAGTNTNCIQSNQDSTLIENCILTKPSGSPTTAYGIAIYGGSGVGTTIRHCDISTATGTSKYAIGTSTAANNVSIEATRLNAATADIQISHASSIVTLDDVVLVGGVIDATTGILRGSAIDDKNRDCGSVVKNTSGATVNRGDVGYINDDGEFKTTTTAQDAIDWNVVTAGGANNSLIFVKNKGNATVNYTGTAPNAGEFLVTSTTAGVAQAQTTMHYAIFAVCLAAGSGGKVEALLLCNTKFVIKFSTALFYQSVNHSSSLFVATINGAPSATSVVYTPVSGSENFLVPAAAGYLSLLRLWNTTRNTYRLVTAVNTGTNTITTVSSTDAWANGDTITITSQTIAAGVSPEFCEMDLTQQTTIPILARAVRVGLLLADSGGAGGALAQTHPVETFDNSKTIPLLQTTQSTAQNSAHVTIPLVNQGWGRRVSASGAATITTEQYFVIGYDIASP